MHGLHAPDTQLYIENDVCLWFINEFSFIYSNGKFVDIVFEI